MQGPHPQRAVQFDAHFVVVDRVAAIGAGVFANRFAIVFEPRYRVRTFLRRADFAFGLLRNESLREEISK